MVQPGDVGETMKEEENLMTNQQVDPALRAHLAELTELAREIGAVEVIVIRRPQVAELIIDLGGPYVETWQLAGDGPAGPLPAGVLVVLRFPQSDGGAAGVEVK
jgi:hypothetical protein